MRLSGRILKIESFLLKYENYIFSNLGKAMRLKTHRGKITVTQRGEGTGSQSQYICKHFVFSLKNLHF